MRAARLMLMILAAVLLAGHVAPPAIARERPLNVLLFTADDLNADSLGCYGCRVPDITPNLDKFALQGLRFARGHVTVAICQPSRGVLATGRYPHHSTVMGFMHASKDVPTLMESFGDAGYLTGILGKVTHSTPEKDYRWDYAADQPALGAGRSPTKYYEHCKIFFEKCRAAGKPFYFMVNSHDPHRPYHIPAKHPRNLGAKKGARNRLKGAEQPSRIYSPEEIVVPGFLPNLPGVREEVSFYFNSVKRLDDTFGRVMAALEESGNADNTLVMFITDNGVALPFAKCNAYLASTRSPWIIRWPGVAKPGVTEEQHFVSAIDFMPTALDAAGIEPPAGMDGRSFVPLLRGGKQDGRDRVFTQIDCKAGGDAVPMRCLQTAEFAYIFNGWADGEHRYRNNNEGLTMKAMERAAATSPEIAERVRVFRWRDVEEFYDLKSDPNCLVNLAKVPQHQNRFQAMRNEMRAWMKRTDDPLLNAFELRENPRAMEDAMIEDYAQYRGNRKAKKARKANRDRKKD